MKKSLVEIAQKVDVTSKYLSDISLKRRRPSPKLARKLEIIFKVDRRKFLYPEEFGDPWIELKSISSVNR
ncbi:MAG: hypothetical protein HQK79_20660 [Desulfobacterales bacterium]|nr:hypothetical protein [Desulfobacterales bacterium]